MLHRCGTNERRTLKIELLSQWKLEAESLNWGRCFASRYADWMKIQNLRMARLTWVCARDTWVSNKSFFWNTLMSTRGTQNVWIFLQESMALQNSTLKYVHNMTFLDMLDKQQHFMIPNGHGTWEVKRNGLWWSGDLFVFDFVHNNSRTLFARDDCSWRRGGGSKNWEGVQQHKWLQNGSIFIIV